MSDKFWYGVLGAMVAGILFVEGYLLYSIGYTNGSQTVPMAVIPRDSTVILYRTVKVPAPKPDTALRYICKEAK